MNGRPLLTAAVGGFPAWLYAPVLERESSRLVELAGRRGFPPEALEQARVAVAAVRAAADEWQAWRISVDGNAEIGQAEVTPGLEHDNVSTGQAGVMLGLTSRMVRVLLARGLLEGRRVGGRWLVSRVSVVALSEARRIA